MGTSRLQTAPHASALALEANATWAGMALACAYSSSDEYEAEIIRARRAAGAYGTRHRWQAYLAFAVAAVAIVAVLVTL